MTNETTASQPKSIGDDAQFQRLLTAWGITKAGSNDCVDTFNALVTYIDSRAPAAQASATIQAAPTGILTADDEKLLFNIDTQPYGEDGVGRGRQLAMMAAKIIRRLAATIQEPVMVAESVGVVSVQELSDLVDRALALPKSLSTRSWELTPIQLGWIIGQVCRSSVAATVKAVPSEALLPNTRAWVAAEQARLDTNRAYNAAIEAAKKFEWPGPDTNTEYQCMNDAQNKAHCAKFPMFDELVQFFAAPLADKTGGAQ